MDDRRVGLVVRRLRRRREWRQRDLAAVVGCSQSMISLVERGHLDSISVRALRAILKALDALVVVEVRWRGGQVDRLLDEDHAALGGAVASALAKTGWEVRAEATYSRYGERGAIDLLGWHAGTATLLVVEVKTEITPRRRRCASSIRRRGSRPRSLANDSAGRRRGLGNSLCFRT